VPVFLALIALGTLATRAVTGSAPPIAVLVVAAIVGMVLTDITVLPTQALRDLGIYVKAGAHYAANERVYLDGLVTSVPQDRTDYPYLYPPFTLPFVAVLAALPFPLVATAWVALQVVAAVLTFRLIGIRPRWWLVLLAWPPVFQGLFVANVSIFAGFLFAAGPWFGAGLLLAGVFKVYSALAGLWLARERRWRPIVTAVVALAAVSLMTLPLTGIERWREWIAGLVWFRQSQDLLPNSLYGIALPHYLPQIVAVAIGAAVVAAAWFARRTEGLARFGVATIVASPSLYAHGIIPGLPAMTTLRLRWAWLVVAVTSVVPGEAWWAAIAFICLSWFALVLRRPAITLPPASAAGRGGEIAAFDLLGGAAHPWPNLPTEDAARVPPRAVDVAERSGVRSA
jgi:Glycosyltransferase family 87